MMLECKTYTYAEFSALFNTRDNQGIKRRLDRWGIRYSTAGRGTGLKYTIEEFPTHLCRFVFLISASRRRQFLINSPSFSTIFWMMKSLSACRVR